jgi:hypothetical protein
VHRIEEVSTRLPDKHDLLALLGEPRLADAGVPWAYNRLTFELTRGEDQIEATVAPGYGDLLIRWTRNGESLVTIQLGGVRALTVEKVKQRESLVAHFEESSRLRPLRLQLLPQVSVFWGTEPA